METFIASFLVFCISVAVLYCLLMMMLMVGWISLKKFQDKGSSHDLKLSILIPARNEEKTIAECLASITRQSYPPDKMEIIVIDDHSTDNTIAEVKNFHKHHPHLDLKLIARNGSDKPGKKAALTAGVDAATSDLIITTDADTTRNASWLAAIAGFYSSHKPQMIIGPVAYKNEQSIFAKMQSIEFAGLVATAGGASGAGMPVMCNGANLAFEKKAFEAAGGYSGDKDIASGDDVMLMSRIDRIAPGSVKFLKTREAIVYTAPSATIKEFINQRIRWASKNKTGYNKFSLVAGIIVLLMNFTVPAALLASVFIRELLLSSVILFGLKCIIDFLFLFLAASFFEKRRYLFLFIPQQLLYMLYVNVTGMLSMFSGYEWKGRMHR